MEIFKNKKSVWFKNGENEPPGQMTKYFYNDNPEIQWNFFVIFFDLLDDMEG